MNYIIYSHAHNKASGGNSVTYELCKLINIYFGEIRCYIAPVFCRGDAISAVNTNITDDHGRSIVDIEKLPDDYFCPEKYNLNGCPLISRELLLRRDSMAIYTEGMLGNPLEQKNIIRWICYFPTPGLPVDPFYPWGKNDTFCFWVYPYYHNREKFYAKLGNPTLIETDYYPDEKDCLFLEIPLLHHDFQDFKGPRKGSCHMVRKGDPNYRRCPGQIWDLSHYSESHPHSKPFDPIFIHPEDSELLDFISPEDTLRIFNEKETFYCYDYYTFHSSMAAMCGCNVIISPHPSFTEEDWSKNNSVLQTGIAFGETRLGHAKETKHLVKSKIMDAINSVQSNLDKFLKIVPKKPSSICYFTEESCSVPTLVESPPVDFPAYTNQYTIYFWKISFTFSQIQTNLLEFKSDYGPFFEIKDGQLFVKMGIEHCFGKINIDEIYKVVLERKGYHLVGHLNGICVFNNIHILYPLSFDKILAHPGICNLLLEYF